MCEGDRGAWSCVLECLPPFPSCGTSLARSVPSSHGTGRFWILRQPKEGFSRQPGQHSSSREGQQHSARAVAQPGLERGFVIRCHRLAGKFSGDVLGQSRLRRASGKPGGKGARQPVWAALGTAARIRTASPVRRSRGI